MRRASVLLSVAVAMVSSGCVVYGGGGPGPVPVTPPSPGDVTFTWTFGGATCADYPQVRSVQIRIPGQALMNNGEYGCLVNNYPGIVLTNFAGGTYSYTVEAHGYGNEVLFATSGSFRVNGNVTVNVDLAPQGSGSSYAYLRWFFPPNSAASNPTCQQAGVTSVAVRIDNGSPDVRPCAEGQSAAGYATPLLAPGTHTVTLSATDQNGYEYYAFSGTLVTANAAPTAQDFTMQWAVGTALLGWTFTNGSVSQTCAQAGISQVLINLQDEQGNNLFGSDWSAVSCAEGATYYYLHPGVYRVFMSARGAGGAIYESNMSNPPAVSVSAGVFPTSPLTLTLFH